MRRKVLYGSQFCVPHFLHRGLCPPSRPKSRPWGRLASKRFAAARSLDAKFSRLTAQKFCCHPRRGKRQKPTACRFCGLKAPGFIWGQVTEASQVPGGRGEENAAQGLVWVVVLCAAFSS